MTILPSAPAPAPAPAPTFNTCRVISKTKEILTGHFGHFRALTLIFLLPISIFNLIYYTLLPPNHFQLLFAGDNISGDRSKTLWLYLTYTLLVFVFSQLAAGTITYSSYHAIYGTPFTLLSSIQSLRHSFLPLAATSALAQIILLPIVIVFVLLLVLTTGFEIGYGSVYFSGFGLLVLGLFLIVVMYIQVSLCLVSVVVVVESKRGLDALRRSWYLIGGTRSVSFSVLFLYGFLNGIYLWTCVSLSSGDDGEWWIWCIVIGVTACLYMSAFMMLHGMVAMTVLYDHCKTIHGELASEVIGDHYVSLLVDDDCKITRESTVA